MSCIGKDCYIARQEAQDPRITQDEMSSTCSQEQVDRLKQEALRKIKADATHTHDTCPEGCTCLPKQGAQPEQTDWVLDGVEPFTLTEGQCTYKVIVATVEIRVVRTAGMCGRRSRGRS